MRAVPDQRDFGFADEVQVGRERPVRRLMPHGGGQNVQLLLVEVVIAGGHVHVQEERRQRRAERQRLAFVVDQSADP